jgi:hypothetical protein
VSLVDSDSDVGIVYAPPVRSGPVPPPIAAKRAPATEPQSPPPPPPAEAIHTRLFAIPGWLISLVLHLAALILLGIFTFRPLLVEPAKAIVVSIADPAAIEVVEEVAIAPQMEEAAQNASVSPGGELSAIADLTHAPLLGDAGASEIATGIDAVDIGGLDEGLMTDGRGLKSLGAGQGSAEFFGVKAGGRRFVFIVDSSNSMRGQKFAEAKEELMYAVRRLDKTQSFYVIFFDQDALRMFTTDKQTPEDRPVPATGANIQKLQRWLPTVENERRTDPYDAVKFAVEMRPDAIFILSDGQFTDGGRTVRYLADNNLVDDPVDGRRPRVVVHTIGFYSKEGEATLKAIAEAYKGTYRFVPPPKMRK